MTHIFKPGRYKTVSGLDAVVLCDDAPGDWPLKGYVVEDSGMISSATSWGKGGDNVTRSAWHLVPPKPPVTSRWMNVYGADRYYSTEQETLSFPGTQSATLRLDFDGDTLIGTEIVWRKE